jgi:uncharacterized protein YutE (UPF0331/DUF86 family)
MTTSTAKVEREELLKIAEQYRNQGYEILFQPSPEDLPDFLKNYCPDLLARRENEAVIVVVKSHSSLDSSSAQYLSALAQVIEQHSGWRFELVIMNPEEATDFSKAEGSLKKSEIESRLQVLRELINQHPESAMLYGWSLVEATLRLVAEHEELSLKRVDPLYLIKRLATEGIISRAEYQLLMNALSLRNAIAHGFKTSQLTQESVHELVNLTENLLQDLTSPSQ